MRILGRISIYGSKPSIEQLASIADVPSGTIEQLGLKRIIPETDSWCYSTAWYRFELATLDDEIRSFLDAHGRVGNALAVPDPGIRYAMFTLCPVESGEEVFACLLSNSTLERLSTLRLALEISPAQVMPNAIHWQEG